jgi:hypothetical protein
MWVQELMCLLLFIGVTGSVSRAQQLPPSMSGLPIRDTPPPPRVGEGTDEDLSSLVLAKPLPAATPELGEFQEYADFTMEMLRVEWRTNDPIYLFVLKPKNVPKPPVILYLYSYPSDSDRFLSRNLGQFLTQHGCAAVGFVSALTGQRYHDRPMKDWFVSNLPEALVTTTHDVQMVLNYLEQRGDLDLQHVGMFGDGSGATIAALAASVDARIKAVDLLNPWADWPVWMAKSALIPEAERPNYVKAEFQQRLQSLDPVKRLPMLTTQKVRLQIVEEGITVTPSASWEHLLAVAPSGAQVVRYKDVQDFAKVAGSGAALDWIKKQVGAELGPQYQAAGTTKAGTAPQPSR